MANKRKFNPYPKGKIKEITKGEYQNLHPEHKQFLELLNEKKELENKLKEVNELIDKRESVLLKRIDSGEKIDWCWKWIFEKTNISWKSICEKFLGKKKIQEISSKTPATEYPHIGVEGFHPRPNEKHKLNLKRKEK